MEHGVENPGDITLFQAKKLAPNYFRYVNELSGVIQVRITPFILDPRWVIQIIYLCENVCGSSHSHEKNVMKFEVFLLHIELMKESTIV